MINIKNYTVTAIYYLIILFSVNCTNNQGVTKMQNWNCSACTFINDTANQECEACFNEKSCQKNNTIEENNDYLPLYEKLLNMGFNGKLSLEASQKHKNNINEAISYINKKNNSIKKSNKWICIQCTLENDLKHISCTMCDYPRNFEKKKNHNHDECEYCMLDEEKEIRHNISIQEQIVIGCEDDQINDECEYCILDEEKEIKHNISIQEQIIIGCEDDQINDENTFRNKKQPIPSPTKLSTAKLPAKYKNITIYFPGMTRENERDGKKIRESLKSTFFISDKEITFGCSVEFTLMERINLYFISFVKYLSSYNDNLPINGIGHSQGGLLGSMTFIKLWEIKGIKPSNFISLACPWLGTILANKEHGYDPNAGSAVDEMLGFLTLFVSKVCDENGFLKLVSGKDYSHVKNKNGLYELGSRNSCLNSKSILNKLTQLECKIYLFVAQNDLAINYRSATCDHFNKNIIKISCDPRIKKMFAHAHIMKNETTIKNIKYIIEG